MATNKKLSSLSAVVALAESALTYAVNAGTSYKITLANLRQNIGCLFTNQITISTNTTLDSTYIGKQILIDDTAGNITVTLPAASTCRIGAAFTLVKSGSGTNITTIQRAGSDTINVLENWGATSTRLMERGQSITLVCDNGTTWAESARSTNSQKIIKLLKSLSTGSEAITIQAPGGLTTSYTVTLPTGQGAPGTSLINDGSGVMTWTPPGSLQAPVGTNSGDGGRVQLQELAANGSEVVRIKAPDAITTSFDLTMPAALPSVSGAALVFSTAGVSSFTSSPVATQADAQSMAFAMNLIFN
jgi:hypothetical protein